MKGALLLLFALAACASGNPGGDPPLDPMEVPSLDGVPALLRPEPEEYLPGSSLLRGALAFELGEVQRSAALLQNARAQPEASARVGALHAWVLLEAGGAEAAQAVAEEGVVRWPGAPQSRAVLAEALLRRDEPEIARAMLQPLVDRGVQDPYVLALHARTAFAQQRWQETLQQLDRLAVRGPLDDRMLRMRARALEGAGRPQDAIPLYERLAAEADVDPILLEEMAFAALRAARSTRNQPLYGRAESLLQRVTALDPQHARAHAGIAECAAARGQVDIAQAAWRRALEVDPADVESGLALAVSLAQNRDRAGAERQLRELRRQPLNAEQARRVDEALADLLSPQGVEGGESEEVGTTGEGGR